ncbi:putative inorganic carbon transporter subunit DabA [Marinobacter sp.]|uniref:putative inorganic carbon transporter subunit DabA n=1 Tax=Marinobacter sp. TaxID=50741 RepID=UPI00384F4CC2
MRQTLEAQDERIQTRGFAGFFELPIACQSSACRHFQGRWGGSGRWLRGIKLLPPANAGSLCFTC